MILDLSIRTSGELRRLEFPCSGRFAYAEIHVTKVLWPDFRRRDLFEATLICQSFTRPRYGAVDESDAQMFIEAEGKPELTAEGRDG